MKRKGRRHLPKLRGRYSRGGGVIRFPSTYWGPININDGGRDAPTKPLSAQTRFVLRSVVATATLALVALVALVAFIATR